MIDFAPKTRPQTVSERVTLWHWICCACLIEQLESVALVLVNDPAMAGRSDTIEICSSIIGRIHRAHFAKPQSWDDETARDGWHPAGAGRTWTEAMDAAGAALRGRYADARIAIAMCGVRVEV